MPSSVEVDVWGLVKALSLIFENDNVEEVWSQRSLKLKKHLDEKVWSWGSFRWWSLKLKKFQVNEVLNWRTLKLKKIEVEESWSWRNLKFNKLEFEEICGWRRLKLKKIEVEVWGSVSLLGLCSYFWRIWIETKSFSDLLM